MLPGPGQDGGIHNKIFRFAGGISKDNSLESQEMYLEQPLSASFIKNYEIRDKIKLQ